jgi:imidazolonepropionase-like amidohydrolase
LVTVIKCGQLVTSTRDDPLLRKAIIVEDRKIKDIVAFEMIPVSGEIVDLSRQTVLPGLIDAHVHIVADSGPVFTAVAQETDGMTGIKAAFHARQTLLGGVTTIRDLGGKNYVEIELKKAIESGCVPGPRMIVCGKCIAITGGHANLIAREADGPQEMCRAVREQLKMGAECIKFISTGGILTPGMDANATHYTKEELEAGIIEAHRMGKKTAAHAIGTEGIRNAVLAGVDSVEHGIILKDDVIQEMKRRETYLVPTLIPVVRNVEHGRTGGIPDYAVKKATALIEDHLVSCERAITAGLKIAMGSDAGTPFNMHGSNSGELYQLVKAGLTPLQAIKAATINGAELLGLQDKIGTIEPGKFADVIAVNGDPINDIRDFKNISMVMKDGQLYYLDL